MALTLCPNCRLPVNRSQPRCPQCGVMRRTTARTARDVSLAATVAVLATAMAALATRKVA